jgi:hypothetical protein
MYSFLFIIDQEPVAFHLSHHSIEIINHNESGFDVELL